VINPKLLSPEEQILCFPIEVPRNDKRLRGTRKCINLVRSVSAPRLDCQPGPLEQVQSDIGKIILKTRESALQISANHVFQKKLNSNKKKFRKNFKKKFQKKFQKIFREIFFSNFFWAITRRFHIQFGACLRKFGGV
jgi:hypothetical protein